MDDRRARRRRRQTSASSSGPFCRPRARHRARSECASGRGRLRLPVEADQAHRVARVELAATRRPRRPRKRLLLPLAHRRQHGARVEQQRAFGTERECDPMFPSLERQTQPGEQRADVGASDDVLDSTLGRDLPARSPTAGAGATGPYARRRPYWPCRPSPFGPTRDSSCTICASAGITGMRWPCGVEHAVHLGEQDEQIRRPRGARPSPRVGHCLRSGFPRWRRCRSR